MTTQGVTVDISALANLFSVLWNRVSRDALLDILISVEHICKTPALTKGDLYAPAYAEKKNPFVSLPPYFCINETGNYSLLANLNFKVKLVKEASPILSLFLSLNCWVRLTITLFQVFILWWYYQYSIVQLTIAASSLFQPFFVHFIKVHENPLKVKV